MSLVNAIIGNLKMTNGAAHSYGLGPSFQRQSAGTYNTTDIFGWMLLNSGDGTVIVTPKGNGSAITLSNAELALMEGSIHYDHASQIQVTGTTTEIQIYIP